MKKRTLLLSLTIVCIAVFVLPAFAEMKNELNNFRGIPWRMAPPQSNRNQWELVDIGPIGGPFKKVYERKNEKLHLGDAEIDSVYYLFHRHLGFAEALLTFASGQQNYELVRKACLDNWGKPDKDTREINKEHGYDLHETYWVGQGVTAELTCYRRNYSARLRIYLNDYPLYIQRDNQEMRQRLQGF